MTSVHAPARVVISSQPLWRLRAVRELPRYTIYLLAVAGLAASVRFAIAPPTPRLPFEYLHRGSSQDPAAAGYAALFARRYLTWNAAEPQSSAQTLEAFLGRGIEADAGLQLPEQGQQRVEWAEVVQEREPAPGEHVYTVAADTNTSGMVYLTVPVVRTAAGALALAGYPAFVGPPAAVAAQLPERLREVSEPALAAVVERALRNYLEASSGELAADLAAGARVSLPTVALALDALQRLVWAQEGSAVLATVQASEGRGAHYTLSYELDVLHAQGRWEITAVQTDPDA